MTPITNGLARAMARASTRAAFATVDPTAATAATSPIVHPASARQVSEFFFLSPFHPTNPPDSSSHLA